MIIYRAHTPRKSCTTCHLRLLFQTNDTPTSSSNKFSNLTFNPSSPLVNPSPSHNPHLELVSDSLALTFHAPHPSPIKPSWQSLHGALLPCHPSTRVFQSPKRKSVFYPWVAAPACCNGILPGNWPPILQEDHLMTLLSAQFPSTARGESQLPPTTVVTAGSPSRKPVASPASHDTLFLKHRAVVCFQCKKLRRPELSPSLFP